MMVTVTVMVEMSTEEIKANQVSFERKKKKTGVLMNNKEKRWNP